jgi:hypothetical protein
VACCSFLCLARDKPKEILMNRELIRIDQDALGHVEGRSPTQEVSRCAVKLLLREISPWSIPAVRTFVPLYRLND